MSKYNFNFSGFEDEQKTGDINILKCGTVYISRRAIERYQLAGKDFVWGEDREKKVLSIKPGEGNHRLGGPDGHYTHITARIAREYVGRYRLVVDEDVLVLVPITPSA